jgi:hypothetical protein
LFAAAEDATPPGGVVAVGVFKVIFAFAASKESTAGSLNGFGGRLTVLEASEAVAEWLSTGAFGELLRYSEKLDFLKVLTSIDCRESAVSDDRAESMIGDRLGATATLVCFTAEAEGLEFLTINLN